MGKVSDLRASPPASGWSITDDHLAHLIKARLRWRAETALLAVLVVALLALALVNLPYYPRTWFDEGSHLHVAKALVQFGRYADVSSEGFRAYGPTLGVGPTVLLPIALVFKLFGIGLVQARLVMALYLLLTFAVAYRLTRHLYGSTVALMAGFLLLTSQGVNILEWGRQVLGEVPTLFFWLAGVLVWFRQSRTSEVLETSEVWRRQMWRVVSGVLFGLAMVTKNQAALIIAPTLIVAWGLNALYYRRLRHADFALPLAVALAVYVAWMAILLIFLGDGDLAGNLTLLRQASGGALFVFAPERIEASLKFLLGLDVFYGWLVPALLYAAFLSLRRDLEGLKSALLVVFVALWLGWYAFGSIGWERYAFPALAVASLFVARLFHDLAALIFRAPLSTDLEHKLSGYIRSIRSINPLTVAFVALFVLMVVRPLPYYIANIFFKPDAGPQQMAEYLNTHVSQAALIETWSPELGFLTDHRYHYPPSGMLDKAVRNTWLGESYPPETYDFRVYDPDYLILDHSPLRAFYPAEYVELGYRLVISLGGYDLYEKDDGR